MDEKVMRLQILQTATNLLTMNAQHAGATPPTEENVMALATTMLNFIVNGPAKG